MKLIRDSVDSSGIAYVLQTKENKIGINADIGDIQLFL